MAEKPETSTKRKVRNPDTFRQRAQKAAEAEDKPSKIGRASRAAVKPVKPAAGLIRRSLIWKGLSKVFRFIGKILRFITPNYFINSWKELRLVTWPSWKQSRQLTGAVLIFAIVFGALIAVVDYGLDKVFKNILLK